MQILIGMGAGIVGGGWKIFQILIAGGGGIFQNFKLKMMKNAYFYIVLNN